MSKINELLGYLEDNIDLKHTRNVEFLHLKTLSYEKVPFLPLSVLYPVDDHYTLFAYSEAFDDPEKMLYNELIGSFSSIYNSVRLKDYFPMHIRSNHGIGIIASLFGAKCQIIDDNMPWVEHLGNMDKIKRIIRKGVPSFVSELGSKVLETHKYYLDKLKEYPQCFEAIHISQPDLQGPFDIAHLLIGPDMFYELYDNPGIVHELLEIITQTYIGFRKFLEPLLTDNAGDLHCYVHGCIYGGKVVIKDDTAAINLSEEMYNEFSGNYNKKILAACNGGSLHYCGQTRTWHQNSMNNEWLRGINYGNPEMHNLEEEYKFWSQYKIPILWWGYNQERGFLENMKNSAISTGISVATRAHSYEEAKEVLVRHTNNE